MSVRLCYAILIIALACPSAEAVKYKFTKVADEDTPAPSGTFDAFDGFVAIDGGTAAFVGDWASLARRGVFTGNGGALTTIAKTGDASPLGPLRSFRDLSTRNGVTAFVGSNQSGGTDAVFSGSGGALATIAKEGDLAPTGTFFGFGNASTDGSKTAFVGAYTATASGIFVSNGGPLVTIAKSGDPAPVGAFGRVGGLAFDGGPVSFVGSYNGSAAKGVFRGSGGPISTLVKSGDPAPSGTFSDFGYHISASGDATAFLGVYNGGTSSGIFTSSGGPLTTIVKTGDPAPVGTFDAIGYPTIRGDTIAFVGVYNGHNGRGVFTATGGVLTEVIGQGDPLFGGIVNALPLDDGQALSLDDSGNVAFLYRLSGRQGVAIAVAVPEPSMLASVCTVVAALASYRGRPRVAWQANGIGRN